MDFHRDMYTYYSCKQHIGKVRTYATTYKSIDNRSALAEFVCHHEEKTEI